MPGQCTACPRGVGHGHSLFARMVPPFHAAALLFVVGGGLLLTVDEDEGAGLRGRWGSRLGAASLPGEQLVV